MTHERPQEERNPSRAGSPDNGSQGVQARGLDDLLATVVPEDRDGERVARLELPADWAQGRASFGGLVVAGAVRALRSHLSGDDADRRPRSLQVAFLAPVAPGRAEVFSRVLRRGGSVTQLEARVLQGDQVRTVVLAACGGDRPSGLALAGPEPPPMPEPDDLDELPHVPGVTPEFIRHLGLRWAVGELPFSAPADRPDDSPDLPDGSGARPTTDSDERGRVLGGWCRLRQAAEGSSGAATEEHLIALVDAWPTPVLAQLAAPAPASTLSWQLDLVAPPEPEARADHWWRFHCRAEDAAAGYTHTRAALWSPAGHLVALSSQCDATFG